MSNSGLMKTFFNVVGMESVKLGFTLGDLEGLNCLAEDSGEFVVDPEFSQL